MPNPLAAVFACALCVSLALPAAAQGQSFGIGARISMIRAEDAPDDSDRERFLGGQVRLRLSPRTAIEGSLDVRTETSELDDVRIRSMPLQASLLLYPASGSFSPYLLGGPGWYSQRVQTLVAGEVTDTVTTREFGWHAGFGAELRLGRHAGLHGDYRYTFLDWGGDDEADQDDEGFLGRLLPSHGGSMWTAGVTIYF